MGDLIFIIIFSIATVEFIILSTLAFICFRKKTALSVHIGMVFVFAIIAMISYLHAFALRTEPSARYFYFMYYGSITLLLNALYLFTIRYSANSKTNLFSKHLSLTISITDVILLLFFTITKNLPNTIQTQFFGKPVLIPGSQHWYFNVHLSICYLFSLGIICMLIYKACISPRHNRFRYTLVLTTFLSILIINGIFLMRKYIFDATNYFYGLAALLVYYYCFKYRSKNYLLYVTKNILHDSPHLIFHFDENHKCTWYNYSTKKFLGKIPDVRNYLEREFEQWRNNSTQFEDMENEFNWRAKMHTKDETLDFNFLLRKKTDNLGNYIGCYFAITDITEQIKEEERNKYLLGMDKLTEIPNRDCFFTNVKKTIKAKSNSTYLLICSNIVDFKIFNNIFGEDAGNNVLKRCAGYMAEYKEFSPAYGRISGDMFAMLLPEELYREEPFLDVINKMETEFSNSFYHMHMHMGVYRITNVNEPVSAMCEKAILSMKLKKYDFNRHISWFREDSLDQNLREKLVMGKFEQALKNGEFKIFLQPQVTKDHKVIGAEALARWIDEDGKIISPEKFIPILEKNSIISKLDLYVWEEAARLLARWKLIGRSDLHIAVNISVKDFYHEDLYTVFTELVKKYKIEPNRLKLEITETAIISDTAAINGLLQRLREFGFEIELDDFGAGYSSLGLLKDITVDTIKIDMSFLRKSTNSSEEKAWLILKEIARLAEILKMNTIVEGVEEELQVEKLASFGCNTFQGYYFASPETVSSFEERVHIL